VRCAHLLRLQAARIEAALKGAIDTPALRRWALAACLVVTSFALSPTPAGADDSYDYHLVTLSNDTALIAARSAPPQPAGYSDVAAATIRRPAPAPAPGSTAIEGIATWYGGEDGFDLGDGMADGTPFNPDDPTIAAANRWPLGTALRVCHRDRCICVRVRDRGGFHHAVDLSRAAFALLAPLSTGVIDVTVEPLP
jgi:rare lipoprotein A (peptidoglycan hydrolase)